jgi:hypothetical protein
MKKKILWALLIVVIVIQFIHPAKNRSQAIAANDISQHYDVPGNVRDILKKSCNDCHSNNTEYPWYSHVQPVGWWLQHHVNEGKGALNFSEFAGYDIEDRAHLLEELIEEVEKDHMPLNSYLWIHKEAKLTKDEKKTLMLWAGVLGEQIEVKHNLKK